MGLFSFLGGLLGIGGGPSRKIEVSKASASSGLQIVYGSRRVEPVTVFKIASNKDMPIGNPGPDGQVQLNVNGYNHIQNAYSRHREGVKGKNNWLHRIDVWGQGPIEGIERFWLDGDVSSSRRFWKRPYFRAASKYGSDPQSVASELVLGHSEWRNSHQGHGVAYTWSRYYNSKKKAEFTSEPELHAKIKGLRIYDPRQDDSRSDFVGVSGSQRFADAGTWTFSNNRALVVLNYLMSRHGLNAQESELDIPSFITAANVCDNSFQIPDPATNDTGAEVVDHFDFTVGDFINIPIGNHFPRQISDEFPFSTPQGTEKRLPKFTANAVLDPKTGVVNNTKKLLEGMGWALPWSNGKHKLIIETLVETPEMTFDEDSILGGWNIERGRRSNRLNRVTIEYPNENKDYETDTVSWPALSSTTYSNMLAEDNGQHLETNVKVDTITSSFAAQAHGEYLVRKSRVDMKVTGLKLAPKAMLLEPGDVIAITYPEKNFSNTKFIVERVSISAQLDVSVDLILYDQTVYGAPELEQEPIVGSPYNTDLWQDAVAVENLQLSPLHESNADGSVVSSLRVSWTEPTILDDVTAYEVRWKKDGETEYENSRFLTAVSSATKISGLVDNTNYTVEVTYNTRRGRRSDPAEKTEFLDPIPTQLDELVAGANVQVLRQTTAPAVAGLNAGTFWFDTSNNKLFVLSNGDWVETVILNQTYYSTTAPAGALGDFWYDTDDFVLHQHNGSQWEVVAFSVTNTNQLVDGAGLGVSAAWASVSGRSKIAVAINEDANGNQNLKMVRFFGFGVDGNYPDRSVKATIVAPNGAEFTWGGSAASQTAYSGNGSDGVYYIVLDTGGLNRFTHTGTHSRKVGVCKINNGTTLEYFKAQHGWTSITHDSNMIVIGFVERRAGQFVHAGIFEPTSIAQAPSIFSMVGIDSPAHLPIESIAGVYTLDPIAPCKGYDNGSSARIDVAATTIHYGDDTLSYNSGSITGLSFSTDYWIYAVDDNFVGGTVNYAVTTDRTAFPARSVYFGQCKTPANGAPLTTAYPGGYAGMGGARDNTFVEPQ